jgi:hypothetical protein
MEDLKFAEKINWFFYISNDAFFIHVNFKRSLLIGNFIFFTFYSVLEGEEKKLLDLFIYYELFLGFLWIFGFFGII